MGGKSSKKTMEALAAQSSPTPTATSPNPYQDIPGITGSRQFNAWMPGQAEGIASQLAGGFGGQGATQQNMLAELLNNTANMRAPIYGGIQSLTGNGVRGDWGSNGGLAPNPSTPAPKKDFNPNDGNLQLVDMSPSMEKLLKGRGKTFEQFITRK